MSYIPDGEVILAAPLHHLLQQVSELMLYPRLAREQLPSLLTPRADVLSGEKINFRLSDDLWLVVSSSEFASVLTPEELALQVKCVFNSNTANVNIKLENNTRGLGFLTTMQAQILFDRWHAGQQFSQ